MINHLDNLLEKLFDTEIDNVSENAISFDPSDAIFRGGLTNKNKLNVYLVDAQIASCIPTSAFVRFRMAWCIKPVPHKVLYEFELRRMIDHLNKLLRYAFLAQIDEITDVARSAFNRQIKSGGIMSVVKRNNTMNGYKWDLVLGLRVNNKFLLTACQEVCRSYHASVDFRTKLLGFLPLASGAGILLLVNEAFVNGAKKSFAMPYALPIGVFGFMVTLGLFFYELNGIRRCNSLITEGQRIEKELDIEGQFRRYPEDVLGWIGPGLASQVIYSAVLAAWAYVASFFSFGPTVSAILAVALFIVFFVGSRRLPLGKPKLVGGDDSE